MADYYGTVAEADAYHEARGNGAVWDGADVEEADKIVALLLASEWVDQNYGASFDGYKTGERVQLREWPRTNAFDVYKKTITGVPVEVEHATYEVALQQIRQNGSLFKTWTASKDIKQVSVDGAISVTFAGASSLTDVQISIPKIGAILAPVLTGQAVSHASGRVSRI